MTRLVERLRQNLWLIRTCSDLATFRALKGWSRSTAHHGELHLRGLDAPVIYRPWATDVPVVWELFGGAEYSCNIGWPFRIVVDCGANAGLFFAWAMRESRGKLTRYVGVEPDPESFATLERQVASFSMKERAQLIRAAVWDTDGTVSFDDEGPSWGRSVKPVGAKQVRACSMATILDEAGVDRADLIKIDIEGGEKTVLATLDAWAHRVNAIVVELHGGLDDEWFSAMLRPHGFRAFATGKLFREHPGAVRIGSALDEALQKRQARGVVAGPALFLPEALDSASGTVAALM